MTATSHQLASARRYRIERYLTEGGMGAIYVGKKIGPGGFEKEVVLKQLLPEYTSRPEFRDLFFREAKISATLDHANIVHTFDLVESDESLFIVMEYVRGTDLRTIVRRAKLRRRELAPGAALHITLEVLAGLAYAHNRKSVEGASLAIIHRDVSPSNILCSVQGEVKLSDFGIAKAATHSSLFYRVRGKVGYMSPEQARNQPIDARTDLYSVAVCLYEALTAERLFVGDLSTPADVLYSQPIVPPSQKRKLLPHALDVVLATALAPKPEDRYQDAVAFAEALRQVAHRHGLGFSAPQLAEHLRHILGRNPEQWLSDDKAGPTGDPSTQKIAKELEGKEAKSIGVVMEGANLYVVEGSDVVSPKAPAVNSRNPKSDPLRKLPSRFGADEDESDDTTRRQPDPVSAGSNGFGDPMIPIDEDDDDDEIPTTIREPAAVDLNAVDPAAFTPPPPRTSQPFRPAKIAPPPPPARPARFDNANAFMPPPPLPPESPFDEFPPTPGPDPMFSAQRNDDEPEFSSETPAPLPPSLPFPPLPALSQPYGNLPPPPPLNFGGGPPPGRPSLPRPGGYLEPGNGAAPNLHMPPAPPAPAYDQGGGFGGGFPETVDFGRNSAPIVVKRSGPPGFVVLLTLIAGAAGGAWLGEKVTHNAMAALEASTA
ncbi:MAG TPA: serine/threonine-protein kinase, partial [Vicinamibacterales bacterium]|nr:serine/threonine-protein kinase [Vicinamibacterales bacterium]